MALYHRDVHGGGGQLIDINLIEPLARLLEAATLAYDQLGTIPAASATGSTPARPATRTAPPTTSGWRCRARRRTSPMRVYRAIGRPELAEDPTTSTPSAARSAALEVDELVAKWVCRAHARRGDGGVPRGRGGGRARSTTRSSCCADEHLRARVRSSTVDDPDFGADDRAGAGRAVMSETPGQCRPPRARPRRRQRSGVRRLARSRARTRLGELQAAGVI